MAHHQAIVRGGEQLVRGAHSPPNTTLPSLRAPRSASFDASASLDVSASFDASVSFDVSAYLLDSLIHFHSSMHSHSHFLRLTLDAYSLFRFYSYFTFCRYFLNQSNVVPVTILVTSSRAIMPCFLFHTPSF